MIRSKSAEWSNFKNLINQKHQPIKFDLRFFWITGYCYKQILPGKTLESSLTNWIFCIYHQVDWKSNVIYMLLCAICKIKHVANSEASSNLRTNIQWKEVKTLTSLKHVIILLPNLLEQLRNTRTTSVETLNRKLRESRNFWIKHHLILIKKLIKPMLCSPTDVRLFACLKTWRQIIINV